MRLRSMTVIGMLGIALAVPAQAEQKSDPAAQIESLFNSGVLFQGVVREEDVTLLFAHIRAALLAAHQGREAPAPEAINRRVEEIVLELKTRGTFAGLLLLTVLEATALQALREALPGPAGAAR